MSMIIDFFMRHPRRSCAFNNLGQLRYLSVMKCMDAVIGNPSSGSIEAPAPAIPTVNMGDRQRGRVRANSVIDFPGAASGIHDAIQLALSEKFRNTLYGPQGPLGGGTASKKIHALITDSDLSVPVSKACYDGEFSFSLPDGQQGDTV